MKNRKINAFTLAEVLITLGIIGVVAALTLPTLIQSHRKQIVETSLAKFSSEMNQAILMSVKDNGDYMYWDDYFIMELKDENNQEIKNEDGTPIEQNTLISTAFSKYLAPYLKIVSSKEITDGEGYKRVLRYFADGTAFAYNTRENRDIEFFPKNAEKCITRAWEDRAGSCSFAFEFYPISPLPYWRYLYKKGLVPALYDWSGVADDLYDDSSRGCGSGESPAYCTAIIQQNGWKIPKDYPRKISF